MLVTLRSGECGEKEGGEGGGGSSEVGVWGFLLIVRFVFAVWGGGGARGVGGSLLGFVSDFLLAVV